MSECSHSCGWVCSERSVFYVSFCYFNRGTSLGYLSAVEHSLIDLVTAEINDEIDREIISALLINERQYYSEHYGNGRI